MRELSQTPGRADVFLSRCGIDPSSPALLAELQGAMGESFLGTRVVGVIAEWEGELRLEIRNRKTRRVIAFVIGSPAYIARALHALGLRAPASLVPTLSKSRRRPGVTFVRGEPAHGHSKRAR